MPSVTGPDGRKLNFPEGTDPQLVMRVLREQYPDADWGQPQESRQQKYERIKAELDRKNGTQGLDPTAGMSGAEKFMAGFGKSLVDTAEGVGQLFGAVDTQDVERRRALDTQLMDTGAGTFGNIVGQGVQMAAPVPAGAAIKATSWAGKAAPYVGAAARAGVFGGLQGVGEGESRVARAGASAALGAAGQGVASAAGGLARGAIAKADPYTAQLADKARQLGVQLGVPNISENPLVRTLASQMERLPFSGAGKRFNANQEAVNREVGKAIGIPDAKRITPDVFADAKTRIGNQFNALSARNNLSLNTQHVADVKQVVDEAGRLGGAEFGASVRNWANDLFSRVDANGSIPGAAYKSFDSKLGKAMASGGEKSYYLGQLREVVRDAMDSSISAGDRAAWQAARKQWAALKTIEPLVAKSPNGNIPPSQLMGRVTADGAGKSRMAAGNGGDLGDLARVSQRFLKDAPNSGTADRLLVNGAIGGGLLGAQQMGVIDPQTALMLGGGLLANRGLLKALNSRALTAGEGPAVNGLARLLQTAPKALPATLGGPVALTITGGRLATPEDLARDEEIVRRFRERR
jgi:hypothetical protein